jgi:hypothetical protein
MDIDLLGNKIANEIDGIVNVIREVCRQDVVPDGLVFDPDAVVGLRIAEDAGYEGVRITLPCLLGKARVPMQIDIGFGDVVSPAPAEIELPTILNLPPPKLLGYTRETAIAEKFQAMVKLGLYNSRMKDFFDIWSLCRQGDFEGAVLSEAIRSTFANRNTKVVVSPIALTPAFASDENKVRQWQAFIRKLRLEPAPPELAAVVNQVAEFLQPVVAALIAKSAPPAKWQAPGPWTQIGKIGS